LHCDGKSRILVREGTTEGRAVQPEGQERSWVSWRGADGAACSLPTSIGLGSVNLLVAHCGRLAVSCFLLPPNILSHARLSCVFTLICQFKPPESDFFRRDGFRHFSRSGIVALVPWAGVTYVHNGRPRPGL